MKKKIFFIVYYLTIIFSLTSCLEALAFSCIEFDGDCTTSGIPNNIDSIQYSIYNKTSEYSFLTIKIQLNKNIDIPFYESNEYITNITNVRLTTIFNDRSISFPSPYRCDRENSPSDEEINSIKKNTVLIMTNTLIVFQYIIKLIFYLKYQIKYQK